MTPSESTPYVYAYDGKLFNLRTLKFLDSTDKGPYAEVLRRDSHASFFGTEKDYYKARFKNSVFEILKNRNIEIQDSSGKFLSTIVDPDPTWKLDNVSGNFVLIESSTGVLSVIRFEGERGYRILKYNEIGNIIGRWDIPHTKYKIEGNTRYSTPYLYYHANTDIELVFSSLRGGPSEIQILNHITGNIKITDGIAGGIILKENENVLAGIIRYNYQDRKIEVELGEKRWVIENENGDNTLKTVLEKDILYVASYHWISTGSAVNAYEASTGKLLWKGEVKQINASHSEYYNTVYLTKFEDKLILEGNEAYGQYLQILDAKTGKLLFTTIPW